MKLLQENKTAILNLLKTHGALSVDQMTDMLKLSKTNVRQHLVSLEKQNFIERNRQKQKQGPGRPQLLFKIKEDAMNRLFPTAEPQMLRELLKHLIDEGNEAILNRFLEEFWKQRFKRFEGLLATNKKKGFAGRLDALKRLLEEEGFMPKLSNRGEHKIIKECNCPFRETVKVTSLPCVLELRFIEKALATSASRLSYMPMGQPTCDYSVTRKKA